MPRPKKSARGKHRWIGLRFAFEVSRSEASGILSALVDENGCEIFDISKREKRTLAILKVPLKFYPDSKILLNELANVSTLTSSGKIRLVRERLDSIR